MEWMNLSHERSIEEVGKHLKLIRKELTWSQPKVSELTGLSVQTIVNIEKGNDFSIDSLMRLLRAYKILNRMEDLLQLPPKPLYQQFLDSK